MFPREVKEIDWKKYIEYKGFKEMRDMESKVEGEKIELFKENKKLKEENKKLKEELETYKKQYEHSMWEDYIDKDLYDLDC